MKTSRFISGIIILFISSCAEKESAWKTAEEYVAMARKQEGCSSKFSCLDSALIIDSTLAELYLEKGDCYRENKKLDSALIMYNSAVNYKPNFSLTLALRSLVYSMMNENSSALNDARNSLRLDSLSGMGHYAMGVYYDKIEKDLAEANLHYRKAIELDTNIVEAYFYFAYNLDEAGKKDSAFEILTKAVKKGPRKAGIWGNYGLLAYELGKNVVAFEAFDSAAAIDSLAYGVYYNRGVLLLNEEDTLGAIQDFDKFL